MICSAASSTYLLVHLNSSENFKFRLALFSNWICCGEIKMHDDPRQLRSHINLPILEAAPHFCLDSRLKLTRPWALSCRGEHYDAWALLDRRAPNTKPWEVQYAGSIWQYRYLVISQLYKYDIEMLIRMASTSYIMSTQSEVIVLWHCERRPEAPFEGLKAALPTDLPRLPAVPGGKKGGKKGFPWHGLWNLLKNSGVKGGRLLKSDLYRSP